MRQNILPSLLAGSETGRQASSPSSLSLITASSPCISRASAQCRKSVSRLRHRPILISNGWTASEVSGRRRLRRSSSTSTAHWLPSLLSSQTEIGPGRTARWKTTSKSFRRKPVRLTEGAYLKSLIGTFCLHLQRL